MHDCDVAGLPTTQARALSAWPRRALLALTLALPGAAAGPVFALDPALLLTQYGHRAWTADESEGALPQNSVFSIVQTRDGYLWLATQGGLARFDGVRFTVFDARNTPALRHNDVWRLLEDRQGNLWIGTRGGGLTRYRDGVFSNFSKADGLSSDHIQALWQDRDGSLWIGTRGGGLNRLRDGKFTVFTTADGLAHDTVYALLGEPDGTLWIGTDGGGISRLRDGKFETLSTAQGLPNATVYALHPDGGAGLWIGTGNGLAHWENGRITATYRTAQGLSNDNIRDLRLDRQGNLWIGTDGGGLNRFRNGSFSAMTTDQGLSSDSIGAIFEDREGSLWVGTDAGGLNRLKDNRFVPWGEPEGLTNENARSILEDRDGTLWIGTFGGLFRHRGDGFRRLTTADGLSSDVILSLAQTRDGDLWAGTLGAGLNRLRGSRVTHYGKAQGLGNDTVLSLLEDRNGVLWAGTRSGGLHRFENGRFRAFTTADGLSSNDVRYLLEGRDGALWIGTLGGGLNRYQDGRFTAFTTAQGLSNDLVLALHEDANGVLWIGTFGGGLNRYQDGRFTAFTAREGLPDDTVFQILEHDDALWMSSNHGVFRVAKDDLDAVAEGRHPMLSPVVYGRADGMRSSECNGAHQPAGWQTRDGHLWFPTIRGVVSLDPRSLAPNPVPPPVVIEELLVDGEAVPLAPEVALPPGRRALEFGFTGLSLLAPEKVRFRYRLDGYDEDWIAAGTRRTAHYTNLPPGPYRFRVEASNNDGVWSAAPATQILRLEPFFWQRRLFWLVYVAAIAGALALGAQFHRRRVRQLKARELELLTLMNERAQAEDALRAANRALELRVRDLARHSYDVAAPGLQVTVKPLPENGGERPAMGQLVQDFNHLLEQLQRRERDLQETRDQLAQEVAEKTRANEDLEQALQDLRMAQAQLVQSEKLASLGSLVAGVAHEINTPVGVGVTAASTLQDWAERLEQRHQEGGVSPAELESFVAVARESTQILLKNLQRAADLIQSFKQVAVDQASGERRRFALRNYIEEVLLSLAPRLNRSPHRVSVECPPGLVVDTYPGALAQILTNLIGNSLAHGFPPGRTGAIRITARSDRDDVVLRYADDGVGIPPENMPHIFDPFFTTKRGTGGSGLGLHIVYKLATQTLGGSIAADDNAGHGVAFELRFPATARRAT